MFVHATRINKQLEYLRSRGIDTRPILEEARLSEVEIIDPEITIPFEKYQQVLSYAIEQTGEEYYGLTFGQEPHIAGTVGMLSASCKDLKEAFIQGCKFFKLQGNFAEILFLEDPHFPLIRYTPVMEWLIKYPETARHEVDATFSFLASIVKINSNGSVKPDKINLTREPPADNTPYKKAFGIEPNYNQESNEMIFRGSDLKIPMKAFNPETFRLLKNFMDQQLQKMENQETIKDQVKSILMASMQYHFPDIETVAQKLHISSRTLQRYLSNENTSFIQILKDTKFDLAKRLLKQKGLTISEIGFTLGYSDISNFSRSFKKYQGVSPQEFRKNLAKK